MKKLTKNFHRKEFDCKDGTRVPEVYKYNLIKLATNLQLIRDDLDASITISSGYRTPSHNKREKGASNSQHLYAKAGDLHQSKETPLELYKRIECLIFNKKIHNGGLFLYNWGVHYDVRDKPARGNYSTLYTL